MKKIWGSFLILMGIMLFWLTPTTVKADGDYQINKYNVQADVQKNGDIILTQRLKYQFNGNFHGVYYNQNIKGSQGATDPEVSIEDGHKTIKLTPSDSNQENTFQVTKTENLMKLKVYHSATKDSLTYIYRYRLIGAVKNYQDTAELNWKIIDQGWDKNLHNVTLKVKLPQNNVSKLQAWSHGPTEGYTDVNRKKGQVVMTLKTLPAHDSVETHLLFPTSVTPDSPRVFNQKRKAKVVAAEQQLVKNANTNRKRRIMIYRALMIFGSAVVSVIFLIRFIAYRKHPANKHVIPTPLYHSFDEPDCLPSFAQILLKRSQRADDLALTADLLFEVGKRRMKLDKYGSTYEITALKEPTNPLFKYLIEGIGDGKKVTLRQIKSVAQSLDRDKLYKRFKKWSRDAAEGSEKYFDKENIDIVDDFRIMAFSNTFILGIMFVISAIFGRNVLLTGILAIVISIAAWLIWYIAKRKITLYTNLGEQEINQIKAFRRMLKDIDDIKMAEVGDLILWEQFLPYAVVFGVSDKVIKALKVNFSADELDRSLIVPFYFGAGSFMGAGAGSFQSAFASSMGTGIGGSASSMTGGSGGFTGGASGGFGGGSGGAF